MRLRTVFILFAMLSLTILSAAGCGTTEPKKTTTSKPLTVKKVDVEIKDFAFKPETVTIAKESRVTWINKDDGQHTVNSKVFSSGSLGLGESYSYQFMNAGTFKYNCSLHPYMEGTIIVK